MPPDQDYIRKAVELADGWEVNGADEKWANGPFTFDFQIDPADRPHVGVEQWHLDALAAQLMRQVDVLDGYFVTVGNEMEASRVVIYGPKFRAWCGHVIDGGDVNGPDRTMNTIKAIVDSGVLK